MRARLQRGLGRRRHRRAAFEADVTIASGRIERIGRPAEAELDAGEVIDASGRIVAPGFMNGEVASRKGRATSALAVRVLRRS